MTMYHYNKEIIETNKGKLKVISMFKGGSNPCDDTIGAMACTEFQDDYDVKFHDLDTGAGKLALKCDLLNTLKKKVGEIKKKEFI